MAWVKGTRETSASWSKGSREQTTSPFTLKIDGTYYLLIDPTYKLAIQAGTNQWTTETKN